MKKNGFTPILIILIIAILGVAGYFAYKNYFVGPQTSEVGTNLPVTGAINGQKTTIDVSATVKTTVGTMTVLPGWQVSTNNDLGGSEGPVNKIKGIDIKNGEYEIHIFSFSSGRAVCGNKSSLINDYVYFKDQNGYEYFRQKIPSETFPNSLNFCSNGITGKGSDSFGEGEATFGQINYRIPKNPDNIILNQMDNMVASFKINP